MTSPESLQRRAQELRLNGLLAHWSEVADADWVGTLVQWEEQERSRRSLERRLRAAQIEGRPGFGRNPAFFELSCCTD